MRGEFVLGGGEVERGVVHTATTFQTTACLTLICYKTIEARAEKRLKAGLRGVVIGEMVLLESVGKESLREILCVLVTCLPFEANIFVDGFPIAGEDDI